MNLDAILKPVAPFLDEFDAVFKEQMKSNVRLVDTVVKYIIKQRGKRVRPALVLLCAAVCGNVTHQAYIGASMVELLHTAALVHDDVVDEANARRGMLSINAVWKNKVAVLVGDYLLSRGLLVAVDNNAFELLRITSNAVRRMSEGELLQIQKSRQLDIDEQTYYRIIADKTSSLISTCCEIGAVSASDKPEHREALRIYGELVGNAFQIRDDVFDYVSKGMIIGKPVGNDVQEKKITLPLIHALRTAEKKEAKDIIKRIKGNPNKADVKYIVEFVRLHGGLEYAEARAAEMILQAKQQLEVFAPSPAKQSLIDFADYVVMRAM
jgi:octaprenyl-diphosphate synthase